MTLDASNFSERDMISVRTDLLNARIYICAPDVLMLFSDNFDYQVCSRFAHALTVHRHDLPCSAEQGLCTVQQ